MRVLQAKRGDTLRIVGIHTDRGVTVPLSDATLAAEITDGDTRAELTCAVLDPEAGVFEAVLDAAATAQLRPGFFSADIEFTRSLGGVVSTETFTVEILEDITNAPE